MQYKGSFTKVIKELTGFDTSSSANDEKKENEEVKFEKQSVEMKNKEEVFDMENDADVIVKNVKFDMSGKNVTRITSTMKVRGSISSKDNIIIDGCIIGDVVTDGDIQSNSLVVGDIDARNVRLHNAHVKGNIKVREDIEVGAGTVLVSDIYANNVDVRGKVKGNIDAGNSLSLSKEALLYGDSIAEEISMESGARVNGRVSLKSGFDDIDDEFDFTGVY